MIQKHFAEKVSRIIEQDDSVIGLAVAGSWLTNEIDEFSDVDLVLVTKEKVGGNKGLMLSYASRFGKLLTGFTGEHVGEPRVLICLYDEPLLHVDIKFVTLDEFKVRIETPHILVDKGEQLQEALFSSEAKFPYPDFQWIEDRFWIWIHYGLLKIGRGEYFEALDFLSAIRSIVLGPLLLIKNGKLPRGVRKVETALRQEDLKKLKRTIATDDTHSLLEAIAACVEIYRELRIILFDTTIQHQEETEKRVLEFMDEIKSKSL